MLGLILSIRNLNQKVANGLNNNGAKNSVSLQVSYDIFRVHACKHISSYQMEAF